MTFRDRMTTETHAPMPRWLYVLDKTAHGIAITVTLAAFTGWPVFPLVLWVCAALARLGWRLIRVTPSLLHDLTTITLLSDCLTRTAELPPA
ncbi:hypothetical protein BH11GEM2_BH11GEM2_38180 [soil metagenome]